MEIGFVRVVDPVSDGFGLWSNAAKISEKRLGLASRYWAPSLMASMEVEMLANPVSTTIRHPGEWVSNGAINASPEFPFRLRSRTAWVNAGCVVK